MTILDWLGCDVCKSQVHLRYKRPFWLWHEIECTNCGNVIKHGGTREQAEAFISGARRQAELAARARAF